MRCPKTSGPAWRAGWRGTAAESDDRGRMTLTADILRSYRAPRRVVRRLLDDGPREDRALMHLMLGCALIFVAQWPRLAREAHLSNEVPLSGLLAGALFGWLFVAPLLFYGFAAMLHGLMRLRRRRSTMYSARAVTFWSLLAVSPLWLVNGLLVAAAGPGGVVAVVGIGVLALFFYFLISGLREAALEPAGGAA